MACLEQDHEKLAHRVSSVEHESNENKKQIHGLALEATEVKHKLTELFRLSHEFRREMDELGERVAELYLLKKQLNVWNISYLPLT